MFRWAAQLRLKKPSTNGMTEDDFHKVMFYQYMLATLFLNPIISAFLGVNFWEAFVITGTGFFVAFFGTCFFGGVLVPGSNSTSNSTVGTV